MSGISTENKKSDRQAGDGKKKKRPKVVFFHVLSTFNNNMVTVTDMRGDVLAWSSAGMHGFKGAKRATSYAAQVTAEYVAKLMKKSGVTGAQVFVRGIGAGRDSAVRAIYKAEIEVFAVSCYAYLPHNGCRPKKRRRV